MAVKSVCMVRRSGRCIFTTATDPTRRGTVNPERFSRNGELRVLTGADRTSTGMILTMGDHFGYCLNNHLRIAEIDHRAGLSAGRTRPGRYSPCTTQAKSLPPHVPVGADVPRSRAPLRLALLVLWRASAGSTPPTKSTSTRNAANWWIFAYSRKTQSS